MRVYRVCSSAHATLDGEGARLYGGRWNSAGLSVVYTANSLALAILETRVHLRRMPIDYVSLTIEIAADISDARDVILSGLDAGWRSDLAATRRMGDQHFSSFPMVPLKVPSVVVDAEWNLLFSKAYAAAHATIVDLRSLVMDARLWAV